MTTMKDKYIAPEAELFVIRDMSSILGSLSHTGQFDPDDWDEGEEL